VKVIATQDGARFNKKKSRRVKIDSHQTQRNRLFMSGKAGIPSSPSLLKQGRQKKQAMMKKS